MSPVTTVEKIALFLHSLSILHFPFSALSKYIFCEPSMHCERLAAPANYAERPKNKTEGGDAAAHNRNPPARGRPAAINGGDAEARN